MGDRHYSSSRQEAEPKPPTPGVGSTATLQGWQLVICTQQEPAKQSLSLAVLGNGASSD